jgi:hypothetical protein
MSSPRRRVSNEEVIAEEDKDCAPPVTVSANPEQMVEDIITKKTAKEQVFSPFSMMAPNKNWLRNLSMEEIKEMSLRELKMVL